MGALKVFFTGLGAALSSLAAWWSHRQAEERAAADRDRRSAVAGDPSGEWLRKFGEQAKGSSHGTDTRK